MAQFNAHFRNINGDDTYPLTDVIYRSKVDGSLLEVEHDRKALASKSPDEWKKLFAERRMSFEPADMSGIWSKREMVLPDMPLEDIVTMREGWSPLFDAAPLARELGIGSLKVKLCGNSHTGSFKDLGMTVLVSQVNHIIKKGIHPIDAVACASTGDTSAALSAYCAKAGIPSIVFLPAGKTSVAQLIQPISNGSIVLALDTDFDGCMKIVQQVTADNRIYLMGWKVPDTVIIPGGNLGNVSALAKGFEDCLAMGLIDRIPRIIVAQAENANPFFQAYERGFDKLVPMQAKKTLASAIQIGNPVSYPKAVRAIQKTNGMVVSVSEEELANAAHRGDRIGLYCCPHTGVALGALEKLVAAGKIAKDENVVVISTAHGLKFTEFKVGYHEKKLENICSKFANPVFKAPADLGAVMDILKKEMAERRR